MDMDGKAIELIQQSAKAEHFEVERDGLLFSTKALKPVFFEARPEPVDARSLTGLVDFIKADIDKLDPKKVLVVVSPRLVSLISVADGLALRRSTWAQASVDPNPFTFGKPCDPETFNIALQSLFDDAEDRAKVLQLAGTIKSEMAQTSLDDGITQTVEARKNIAFAQNAKIPNPVTLRPWRTFREVAQPSSLFVFRAHAGPALALYEADGNAWKLEAMQNVKAWLAERLPEISIIA
jgi:hypothetical protein